MLSPMTSKVVNGRSALNQADHDLFIDLRKITLPLFAYRCPFLNVDRALFEIALSGRSINCVALLEGIDGSNMNHWPLSRRPASMASENTCPLPGPSHIAAAAKSSLRGCMEAGRATSAEGGVGSAINKVCPWLNAPPRCCGGAMVHLI